MKKILFIALAVMASASFSTALAGKKDKKDKKEAAAPAVVLSTKADSVNYAAGYQQTNGLVDFLMQQKMDTTYMADFISGLREATAKMDDPRYRAHALGFDIAMMISDRFAPGYVEQLKDTETPFNLDMFNEGFYAALLKDTTKYNFDAAQTYFRTYMQKLADDKKEKQKKEGADWLAENAKKEGVVTLPSGLQYKVLQKGDGAVPTANQEVTVKYEGKLIDGTVFDSSYARKEQTNKFKANQVIKGWTEALCLMPVGSTWELYIPYDLAYGERGSGKIPPFATLIFKVELVDITK